MTAPILIGKRFDSPEFVFAGFCAGLGVLGGVWFRWNDFELLSVVLFGIGGLATLAALVLGVRIVATRRWLTATRKGLILTDRHGRREFADEDLADLGFASRNVTVKKEKRAFERKCHLVLKPEGDEEPTVLQFVHTPSLEGADPLGDFLERNVDRLTESASQTLASGGKLAGKNWVLTSDSLTHGEGAARIVVKMSQLDAADVVDGEVCVWVGESERAVVKVPCGSLNALILERLLQRRLESRSGEDSEPPVGPGLGRLIFERDQSLKPDGFNGVLILAGFLWVGLSAAAIDAWGKPWNVLVPIGVPLILGPLIGTAWLFRVNVFRCYDRGVTRSFLRRTREIRYEDVGTFEYKGVRHLTNGVYTGTEIELKFDPWKGGPGDSIKYSAMVTHSDEELEKLRDHISRAIAEGMRGKLVAGLPVDWVSRVRFTPKGLELTPVQRQRRDDKDVVPYDELHEFDMRRGEFYLYRGGKGRGKVVLTTPVSGPNFFPGLYLLVAVTGAKARGTEEE